MLEHWRLKSQLSTQPNVKEVSTMNILAQKKSVVTEIPASHTQWVGGFNAYSKGASIQSMPTEQHRRGWWSALNADAAMSAEQHMNGNNS